MGSFYVPNDYVLKLAREHPEFLPAVSIHPARPDALEELERCLAGGAVMMKCLPNCQNIDCNDRRFAQILGADGGGEVAVARAHRRRAHAAGGAPGVRRSARADVAARMRRDRDRGALRDKERPVRSGVFP